MKGFPHLGSTIIKKPRAYLSAFQQFRFMPIQNKILPVGRSAIFAASTFKAYILQFGKTPSIPRQTYEYISTPRTFFSKSKAFHKALKGKLTLVAGPIFSPRKLAQNVLCTRSPFGPEFSPTYGTDAHSNKKRRGMNVSQKISSTS